MPKGKAAQTDQDPSGDYLVVAFSETRSLSRDLWMLLTSYYGEGVIAGTLAMTADFGTHPTVLVVVGMLLAFVPADSACPSTGL
jgi:hypothetical protein